MEAAPVSDHPLAQPVTTLWGVGLERAALLARLDIRTIGDLLLHRPRRYEDRRHIAPIRDLPPGQPALVRGRVVAHGVKWFKHRTKSVYELILDDGTAYLYCRWWNLPFMEKYFKKDDDVLAYGTIKSGRPRSMDHPETEVAEEGEEPTAHFDRLAPIYPLTEGLPQRWLRGLLWRTLARYEPAIPEPHPEVFPAGLPTRANAIHMLHFPVEQADADVARERLALDEFFELQVAIQTRRRTMQSRAQALPCGGDNRLIKPFLARLGFKLTDAQTRVLREIRQDLGGQYPMRRLLQGDVGSGKTAVAACATLMTLESGFNVALMAPTTILAEQHLRNFSRWFAPLQIPVRLVAGGKESGGLTNGQPGLTIGTHSLVQEGFNLPNLGLVIIDEQHKFGVAQREALLRKGRYPHLLVMTATPIPRTLGLTLYGDLDVSVIDQLPPGRGSIKTYVRGNDALPKVWEFLRQKFKAGRQAYVVYPRLEEGDAENGIKAALDEYQKLGRELAPWKVGMVHGRMPVEEREQMMQQFQRNEVQALLATSVIEVGVDVANATVMLVENAECFGLAQLHQLRGRIGRGSHDSFCILLANLKTQDAVSRLRILTETVDGFRIAEADLALRGPGELCGQDQSGLPQFRFGDLARDLRLVERAREMVGRYLDAVKKEGREVLNSENRRPKTE
jgi:ATP-dependent DNA helicase RecG